MRKRFIDLLVFFALLGIGVMLIMRQREVSAAIIEAVKNCVYRIVPSLFAMTVLATTISKSGYVTWLLRRSKLNGNILTAFILGNLGGYPIGAKLLSGMVDDGVLSPERATCALPFCYSCGPAFSVGIVGIAVFGDTRFGLAALFANFAANLVLYLLFCFSDKYECKCEQKSVVGFSTKLMIESVDSAVSAMIGVCGMIVFFSALRATLVSAIPALSDINQLSAVLEITAISEFSAGELSLPAAATLLGFGGLCVIMQITAIVGGRFSLKIFLLSRFIQLPLSGIIALLISKLFDHIGIAAEVSTKIRLSRSPSLIPIFCVAAMVALTLMKSRENA